jgi:hypothetical protein
VNLARWKITAFTALSVSEKSTTARIAGKLKDLAMTFTASFLGSLVLTVMMTGTDFGGQDLSAYLTEKDGLKTLKETLTLRDVQHGIIGKTAMVWTIEPSGEWRVARARSNKDGSEHLTPVANGKLAPDKLEAVAKGLANANLAGMPEKSGVEAKINPHEVILKFGQKTVTLEGLPARRNLKVAELIRKTATAHEKATADVWERFAHVVQAVESHCQETKQP